MSQRLTPRGLNERAGRGARAGDGRGGPPDREYGDNAGDAMRSTGVTRSFAGASKTGASASDAQRGHKRIGDAPKPASDDPFMGLDDGTVYVPRDRSRQTPFADEGGITDANAGGFLRRTPWDPNER